MPRLFFALKPATGQQLAMAGAAAAPVREAGGAPLTATDLHLTLCFLGTVTDGLLTQLVTSAGRIKARRLHVPLSRMDFWSGARVLCLLPADHYEDERALGLLAQHLRDAAQECGLQPDAKGFRPHVTVARKVAPRTALLHAWPQELERPLPFDADGFVLMQSASNPGSPRYTVRHAWPASSRQ
jgi:2'-5' RNA ligase